MEFRYQNVLVGQKHLETTALPLYLSAPTTPVSLQIVNMAFALTLELTLHIELTYFLVFFLFLSIVCFCSTLLYFRVLLTLITALLGKSLQGWHVTVLVHMTIKLETSQFMDTLITVSCIKPHFSEPIVGHTVSLQSVEHTNTYCTVDLHTHSY